MEVWEDVDEGIGVRLLQAVPQVLQHRQHNVQAVAQVQSNQDVAEAVPGLQANIFGKTRFSSVKAMATSLLAKMATDTRLPQIPRLPIRRVAARVRWENRVKIAMRASCGKYILRCLIITHLCSFGNIMKARRPGPNKRLH